MSSTFFLNARFFHVLSPADLRSCFHGIYHVSWGVFFNRWEQTVTDRLMMIPYYSGSLLPRVSDAPLAIRNVSLANKQSHTPHAAFFVTYLLSAPSRSRLQPLFVLTPSSSNQNTVFFLCPLTRAFRHNGHANSTFQMPLSCSSHFIAVLIQRTPPCKE